MKLSNLFEAVIRDSAHALRLLDLPSDATLDQAKAAWRKLAQKNHPDKHGGNAKAGETMMLVNAAWQFLEKNGLSGKSAKTRRSPTAREYANTTDWTKDDYAGPHNKATIDDLKKMRQFFRDNRGAIHNGGTSFRDEYFEQLIFLGSSDIFTHGVQSMAIETHWPKTETGTPTYIVRDGAQRWKEDSIKWEEKFNNVDAALVFLKKIIANGGPPGFEGKYTPTEKKFEW